MGKKILVGSLEYTLFHTLNEIYFWKILNTQ